MPAPVAITDAIESVLDIYFSGVRHRERAAFILCDNLVEMACKTKAQQHDHTFVMRCGFHAAWNAPGVKLDPRSLGQRVQDSHETRNNLQHGNAAATVHAGFCATAILDSFEVIKFLWPDVNVHPRVLCALRMVGLYAASGDPLIGEAFEDAMRGFGWRTQNNETVRANAVQVEPGRRDFWLWLLRQRLPNIEAILNEIGAP